MRPAAHPAPRLLLRPGLGVFRRDAGSLQVGTGPDRVLLPDTPAVRRLLQAIGDGREPLPGDPEARRWALTLAERGLLAEADRFWRDVGRHPCALSAYAEEPTSAPDRLARRAAARVGCDLPAPCDREAAELLADAGVGVATDPAQATVWLSLSLGEPSREAVDERMRSDLPHLLLSVVEGRVRVGPFVVPGRTACLRCVDAHLADVDPRHPVVVAQAPLARSVSEPRDPALLTLALSWAARDLVTWVDGGRPSTWSATVDVGPELALPRRDWARHPHCGCSWLLAAG